MSEAQSHDLAKPAASAAAMSLWDYACRVYEQQLVKRVCLRLQDQYQANVNIVLWACWLEYQGLELSHQWLDDVLINIDAVNQQTVAKLREVRRLLENSESFTKVQALTIGKQIMAAELMVEKVLLNRLQDLTRRFIERGRRHPLTQDEECLSLAYYFEFLGIPEANKYAFTIERACRQQLAEACSVS